jgi:hypothetical protein
MIKGFELVVSTNSFLEGPPKGTCAISVEAGAQGLWKGNQPYDTTEIGDSVIMIEVGEEWTATDGVDVVWIRDTSKDGLFKSM